MKTNKFSSKVAMMALIISLLVFPSFVAQASDNIKEATISGKVVDLETGEALAGVKISINGVENPVYTDFEGAFEIRGTQLSQMTLCATLISYNEKSVKVNADDLENVSVSLARISR